MNKSFLCFKGTRFFWVSVEMTSEVKQQQIPYRTVRLCIQYHSILVWRVGLTEEKKCQLLMQRLSFILANSSALAKQTDPAAVWGPEWYHPWGQHHLTVKISSSTGDCSSHRESKGLFNSLLSIIVWQAVLLRGWRFAGSWDLRAGCCWQGKEDTAVPPTPGSYAHTCENTCCFPSDSFGDASWRHQFVCTW